MGTESLIKEEYLLGGGGGGGVGVDEEVWAKFGHGKQATRRN